MFRVSLNRWRVWSYKALLIEDDISGIAFEIAAENEELERNDLDKKCLRRRMKLDLHNSHGSNRKRWLLQLKRFWSNLERIKWNRVEVFYSLVAMEILRYILQGECSNYE